MGSILVFVSIILIILFIGAFLYLEIENEKRLREIFTRRVKECENDIINLVKDYITNKNVLSELTELVDSYCEYVLRLDNKCREIKKEVDELQAPKAKTRKTGSSKR